VREPAPEFDRLRRAMVERQIRARGVVDPEVLRAMNEVPRERFVPEDLAALAYADSPLPIGEEQTISQPYIVAAMTEALEPSPGDRVLEIGTGSGYQAAILARLVSRVYTIERLPELANAARARLKGLGFTNVDVLTADGTLGWPEHAPYDGIVVTAGAPHVPAALKRQLREGGRLVIPVGPYPRMQELVRVRRTGKDSWESEYLGGVMFVPLIGEEGWRERDW
jgi:protein-L-isoaspartate(D-aspartate) O-methyltransferase